MTVEELSARLTPQEFAEWQLMDAHEGLPDRRADAHAALLASILANVHRKKGTKAYTPRDFLPPDPWRAAPPARRATPKDGRGIPKLFDALDRLAER